MLICADGQSVYTVTGAGDGIDRLAVGADQHGFQLAQVLVGAPVLGQFDTGAGQLAGILFQLLLKPFEQGEGVGRGAGEPGHHLAIGQSPDLAGIALDDGLAHRHLTVAGDDGGCALAHRQDGGPMPGR